MFQKFYKIVNSIIYTIKIFGPKGYFLILIFLSLLVSFFELIGVSAILPLISLISSEESNNQTIVFKLYNLFFEGNELTNAITFYCFCLICFFCLRAALNIFATYLQSFYTNSIFKTVSIKLFEIFLKQPYRLFTNKNTGELTKIIINEADNISHFIFSFLGFIVDIFIVFTLIALMAFFNLKVTIFSLMLLSFSFIVINKLTKKSIYLSGIERSKSQDEIYKKINGAFGNFKMIKIYDLIDYQIKSYSNSKLRFVNSLTKKSTLLSIPQQLFQAIGMITILGIILYFTIEEPDNLSTVIVSIALFVMVFLRLLPSVMKITNNLQTMMFLNYSFDILKQSLEIQSDIIGFDKIEFKENLILENISFEYDKKKILDDVNIVIQKNSNIAIIGESGSGKSTLINVLVGLISPSQGKVFVDGVEITKRNLGAFRKIIGYVPQDIFLFDGTIAQNITLNSEIDEIRLKNVLIKVNLWDMLKKRDGINTQVGDGGVQLSGGQLQRVGIARALYQNPKILILDEATSALDTHTEDKIISELISISNEYTLIIITHRDKLINVIDYYKLNKGKIEYNELY